MNRMPRKATGGGIANKERGLVVPASRAVRTGLPILTNMYIMIQ